MKVYEYIIAIACLIMVASCTKHEIMYGDSSSSGAGSGGQGTGGGNTDGAITVTDCSQSGDIVWTNHNDGVDYIVDCSLNFNNGSLTIESGVTVEFEASASLEIDRNAYINAVGTPSNPITFTGIGKNVGYWNGIAIISDDVRNTIEGSVIEYAGANPISPIWYNFPAGVLLLETTVNAKLHFNDNFISNCAGTGIVADGGTDILSFSNNRVSGCTNYAVRASAKTIHNISDDNVYLDNVHDFVSIRASRLNLSSNVNWSAQLYGIDGELVIDSGLEIIKGASFIMEPSASIVIEDDGYFTCNGTSSANITFRGLVNDQPSWKGIQFSYKSNDVRNLLSYCVVANAGSDNVSTWNVSDANISLVNDSRAEVRDCVFTDGGACGLSANSGANLIQSGNTFSNNAGDNICN